jgi:hypothetical protein
LDPLPYTAEMPSLLGASGRVDAHAVVAHYLGDNRLSGAYLEFGVGQGRSAVAAVRAHRRAGTCSRWVLFDSFAGLPPPSRRDQGSQFAAGDYAFSRDQVVQFLQSHDAWDDGAIEIVHGLFEDTLAAWTRRATGIAAAVVHVDVDYAESARVVLEAVTPLLQVGTVVMFDDWNCYGASRHRGERWAADQWLRWNGRWTLHPWFPYGWHGQTFFVDTVDA